MNTRFIALVDNLSSEQQDQVTRHLEKSECSYWHWLSNVWFIIDSRSDWDVVKWRVQLSRMFPGTTVFVQRVSEHQPWAVEGPEESHGWLHDNWE